MVEIFLRDCFQFGNDLAVELPRVIPGATAKGYLKQQFKGDQGRRKIDDARPPATQVFADQIEVARQTSIGAPQSAIDAGVFECAEDSARELRNGKQSEPDAVVGIGVCLMDVRGPFPRASIQKLIRKSERIARISILLVTNFANRGIGGTQLGCVTLVSAKLDLTGGGGGQNFVETKVEIVVAKFGNQ